MLRTIICTATLLVVATVAQAEAGGFKGKFNGGNRNHGHQNHHRNNHHNNYRHNHHQHNGHHNYQHHNKYVKHHTYHKPAHYHGYQHNHYAKRYHAPVQQYHAPVEQRYYQVCYHCDAWGYHKYESFTCPKQAAAYVGQLQEAGYYASVDETYEPYESGHIIYKQPQYNQWMP